MKHIICLVVVLLLQACGGFSYVKPLCSAENFENITGLPGDYKFTMMTPDFERSEIPVTLRWAGSTGRYLLNDKPMSVCRIGSRIFSESNKLSEIAEKLVKLKIRDSGFSVVELIPVLSTEGIVSFDMVQLGVAVADLDAAKIPYEIIAPKPDEGDDEPTDKDEKKIMQKIASGDDEPADEILSSLRINNAQTDNIQFASLLKRLSIRFSLDPVDTKKHFKR